jgi:sialic acid synthase SpsE
MPSEADAKVKLGKSIYARKPIKKGELISPEHVTFKSPGGAIPPYLVYEVLGRRAEKDISEDQQLKMEELSSTQEKKYENLNWADYYGK